MRILNTRSSKPEEIASILDTPLLKSNPDIEDVVKGILDDIRSRGDSAVLEYVRKFDCPNADSLIVSDEELDSAYSQVSDTFINAVRYAAQNIRDYHQKQLRTSWFDVKENGCLLGQIIRPLNRVAVLAPAFQAPLPSSLLMAAIPAKIAGVKEIFVSTPPRADGSIHPAMAVAAREVGVDRVYRIGGAHGVAAFAYGTESIPQVDKIVGPGGIYVTTAKRLVYGVVGIDMLAGPSEIVVIADDTANPMYIAADLLSQAEHDPNARAVLLTPSPKVAEQVEREIHRQLEQLSRSKVAKSSLEANGAIIVTNDLDEAIDLANKIAPEHLSLSVAEPMLVLGSIENAGAILIGEYSTEPIGDYVAGPNHILPTSGTARFSSPLSVDDFLKKSSVIMYSRQAILQDGPHAVALAQTEGLDAHANAVRIRLGL
jgi:histidinol dehydrogenase